MDLKVTRQVDIKATTTGVDQAAASVTKLAGAQESLGRSALSVERALEKQQRSLDQNYRSLKQFERAQSDLDKAHAQGLISLNRFNELSALNRMRLDGATKGAQAHSAAMGELRSAAASAAGSLGGMGSILTGLGPAGLAAGAVLGSLALAMTHLVRSSNELADRGGKMVDFSQTVGLTTTQIQALSRAGAEVGITSDKIATGFEKLAVEVEEARDGSGKLFKELAKIDPLLAQQMSVVKDTAEAWDLLSRAAANAATQEQKVALARAAFGRSGGGMVRLMDSTNQAGGLGGLQSAINQTDILSKKLLTTLDDIADKTKITAQTARDNLTSIYAEEVLRAQLRFAEGFLAFSRAAKEFSLSKDWDKFIKDLNSSGLQDILRKAELIPVLGGLASLGRMAARRPPNQEGYGDGFPAESTADNGSMPDWNDTGVQEYLAAIKEVSAIAKLNSITEIQTNQQRERAAQLTLNLAASMGGMTIAGATQLQQAQLQLQVAQARTVPEQQIAQEKLRQFQLTLAQLPPAEAAKIAALERAASEAQVSKAMDDQIRSLQDEVKLIQAREDGTEASVKAAIAYRDALEKTKDATKANQVATATYNAEVARSEAAQRASAEAAQQRANVTLVQQINAENEAYERQKAILNELIRKYSFVPTFIPQESLKTNRAGEFQQGDPGGDKIEGIVTDIGRSFMNAAADIEARGDQVGWSTQVINGVGMSAPYNLTKVNEWRQQQTPEGRAQRAAEMLDSSLSSAAVGSPDELMSVFNKILQGTGAGLSAQDAFLQRQGYQIGSPVGPWGAGGVTEQNIQSLQRLVGIAPQDQQIGMVKTLIGEVEKQPATIARQELLKSLTDQLKSLEDAVNKNTNAQLDPLFSQGHDYLNSLRIGYYKAAEGGVFGPGGPMRLMPLHRYAEGGIANSPQMAMFGEAGPEAFVPLKGGAIPVEIRGGGASNDNSRNVNQNITVNFNGASETPQRRLTARQMAQSFGRGATSAAMRA